MTLLVGRSARRSALHRMAICNHVRAQTSATSGKQRNGWLLSRRILRWSANTAAEQEGST